jgi:hypothetical protein
MQEYYGIDLRDIFLEDPPDTRWLLTHAWNLPMASAFVAARRGGTKFRGWDEGRYLQARLIDAINQVAYILVMVNRDPSKQSPEPPAPFATPTDSKPAGDIPPQDFKPGSFGAVMRDAKIKKMKQLGLETAP